MDLTDALVLDNQMVAPSYYRLELECAPPFTEAVPGQFVMARIDAGDGPFWRRPFSVAGLVKQAGRAVGLELIYRVIGKGTAAMAALKKGQRLNMLGPLGRGFWVEPEYEAIFFAAGGIGIAPVKFLAQSLEGGRRPGTYHFFLGGRGASDLLCRDLLADLDLELHLATEDGSVGWHGLLTEPLEKEAECKEPDVIYACGPSGMLRAVADIAAKIGCRCQVAVETLMACGMGACQGCALPRAGDSGLFLHACQDGPVFDAAKIVIP